MQYKKLPAIFQKVVRSVPNDSIAVPRSLLSALLRISLASLNQAETTKDALKSIIKLSYIAKETSLDQQALEQAIQDCEASNTATNDALPSQSDLKDLEAIFKHAALEQPEDHEALANELQAVANAVASIRENPLELKELYNAVKALCDTKFDLESHKNHLANSMNKNGHPGNISTKNHESADTPDDKGSNNKSLTKSNRVKDIPDPIVMENMQKGLDKLNSDIAELQASDELKSALNDLGASTEEAMDAFIAKLVEQYQHDEQRKEGLEKLTRLQELRKERRAHKKAMEAIGLDVSPKKSIGSSSSNKAKADRDQAVKGSLTKSDDGKTTKYTFKGAFRNRTGIVSRIAQLVSKKLKTQTPDEPENLEVTLSLTCENNADCQATDIEFTIGASATSTESESQATADANEPQPQPAPTGSEQKSSNAHQPAVISNALQPAVPGSTLSMGELLGFIIMTDEYGLPTNAVRDLFEGKDISHSIPYNVLNAADNEFFVHVHNAIAELTTQANFLEIDEFSRNIAQEAVALADLLKQKKNYFLVLSGIVTDENNKPLYRTVSCEFTSRRKKEALKEVLDSYIRPQNTPLVVKTDSLRFYKEYFKDLPIGHQSCIVHAMRYVTGALDKLFERILEVSSNSSLTNEQKNEKYRAIINETEDTATLFACHTILRTILRIDPKIEGSEDYSEADWLQLIEHRKEIRAEFSANCFTLLDNLIRSLGAAKYNEKKKLYEGCSPIKAISSAATYFLNNRDQLSFFLSCPFAGLSTNEVERIIKDIVLFAKRSDRGLSSEGDIRVFAHLGTILRTLSINGIEPFEPLSRLHFWATKYGAATYLYDRIFIDGLEPGSRDIPVRLRDMLLDDPETGCQHWLPDVIEHLLKYGTLDGVEERIKAFVLPKLTYKQRLQAQKEVKDLRKQRNQSKRSRGKARKIDKKETAQVEAKAS